MSPDPAATARRFWPRVLGLGLFLTAMYVGSGASMPFMPVWFQAQGLGGAQLAAILAAPYFGRALFGPFLAVWADRFRLRRTPVAILAAAAAASFLTMVFSHGFWPWLIAWLVGSTLLGALGPLSDVIGLREAHDLGFSYARPRGVGSAAYLFGNVAMGLVLTRTAPASVLIWTIAAAALTAMAASWLLPPTPVHLDGRAPAQLGVSADTLWPLLRDPVFMLALVAIGCIQASHGFYYSFSILVWRQQGLGAWTGPLWGFAVGAEITFMWFLEPLRRRLGPERILALGGLGAVVRWLALSVSPPLWVLFPLQALHSLSFTATYLAGLALVDKLSPPQSASAAQSLNAALYAGVLIGLTTAVSGPLYEAYGARGYLAMAAIAAFGTLLAVGLARGVPRAAVA